jgi:hypothetical protein
VCPNGLRFAVVHAKPVSSLLVSCGRQVMQLCTYF